MRGIRSARAAAHRDPPDATRPRGTAPRGGAARAAFTAPNLHNRLRAWLIPALVLALLGGAAWTVRFARSTAAIAYDQALLATATDVALGLQTHDGAVRFELTAQALQMLGSDVRDSLYFCVRDANGQALAGACDLPAGPLTDPARSLHRRVSQLGEYRGLRVHRVSIPVRIGADEFSVTVAETNLKRRDMAGVVLLGIATPVGAVLCIAAVLVWLAIGNALRPLDALEREVRARAPSDLSPIPLAHAPAEVRPLVSALNDLLAQLASLLESRQRFIADAAHQIRTPLAGLQSRLELARDDLRDAAAGGPQGDGPRDGALHAGDVERLHAIVLRTVRVANQLLALARSEQRLDTLPMRPVDLEELVRRAAPAWVQRALACGIDLGFDLRPARVHGVAALLHEAVDNLVGNALLYAGRGATVDVRIANGADGWVELRVEDSGPGIAEADHERALRRFGRLHDGEAGTPDGTGLGLPIVQEIMRGHGGELLLSRSGLGGLMAVLRWLPEPDPLPQPGD